MDSTVRIGAPITTKTQKTTVHDSLVKVTGATGGSCIFTAVAVAPTTAARRRLLSVSAASPVTDVTFSLIFASDEDAAAGGSTINGAASFGVALTMEMNKKDPSSFPATTAVTVIAPVKTKPADRTAKRKPAAGCDPKGPGCSGSLIGKVSPYVQGLLGYKLPKSKEEQLCANCPSCSGCSRAGQKRGKLLGILSTRSLQPETVMPVAPGKTGVEKKDEAPESPGMVTAGKVSGDKWASPVVSTDGDTPPPPKPAPKPTTLPAPLSPEAAAQKQATQPTVPPPLPPARPGTVVLVTPKTDRSPYLPWGARYTPARGAQESVPIKTYPGGPVDKADKGFPKEPKNPLLTQQPPADADAPRFAAVAGGAALLAGGVGGVEGKGGSGGSGGGSGSASEESGGKHVEDDVLINSILDIDQMNR